VVESKNENEAHKSSESEEQTAYRWKLCNVTAGPDYIPCLDNLLAIRNLRSTKHYDHRKRHGPEEPPTCLVPLPEGYQRSLEWPASREKPVPDIALGKRSQVVLDVRCGVASFGGYLFDKDVLTISFSPKDEHEAQVQFALERAIRRISDVMGTKRLPFPSRVFDMPVPDIALGKRSQVVLDVRCGVASFGGYLFDKDVLTISFSPKDEHEAQVQFALERAIRRISDVMGTKRLPFPSRVFDMVHCALSRVPWHI
ncbi:unnamed protein product, partial [Ilex paraguariensis]